MSNIHQKTSNKLQSKNNMALFTYHNHTHLSCWVNNGNTQNTQDKFTINDSDKVVQKRQKTEVAAAT